MVDRTIEDINQDARLARLEHEGRELRAQFDSALQIQVGHSDKIAQHEDRLNFLNPLTVLLEHVEAIKEFCTNIRSIRRTKE